MTHLPGRDPDGTFDDRGNLYGRRIHYRCHILKCRKGPLSRRTETAQRTERRQGLNHFRLVFVILIVATGRTGLQARSVLPCPTLVGFKAGVSLQL